ncbi:MAG: DNA primase [bacterium]|nr:DNA primase [bacterium]
MASEQELDEIRRRIEIVDLISHYVTLKKAGANYKALCPFHEERTGSFMVSPEKQIYKCFGCNEGGDIFTFIMKMEGLSFPEAIKFLADRSGVKLALTSYNPQEHASKDDKNQLLALNDLAAKYFQMILTNHPSGSKAKEYLYKRCITDESIKKFRLGYAPSNRALADFLTKKGYSVQAISAAGSPDRFVNRIMFPICDAMGNVIAFTGREFPDGSGPKYLNTAETSLYHKSRAIYGLNHAKIALRQNQSVIFVEGQMDVVSSHQAGIQNTVASSGTALTLDHLKIMYRYAQRFILAFDNDEAGQKATEKVIDMALTENYITDVIVFPENFKDAGEIIEKEPSLWPKIVKSAIPAIEWHINRAFSIYDTDSATLNGTQKKQIASRLLPIINKIPDQIEKTHYLDKLYRLGIPREILNQSMSSSPSQSVSKPSSQPSHPAREKLDIESQAIGHFLNNPKAARKLISKLNENYFSLQYKPIVKEVKIWYNQSESNIETKKLVSYLRSQLNETDTLIIDKILNASLNPSNELDAPDDLDSIRSDINQAIDHLKTNYYENRKMDFATAIANAEDSGDRTKVKQLLQDLQTFLQKPGGN